jgi:hypothetical protein
MQNEKLQINFAESVQVAEVIIREVNSVNELPVKAPVKTSISGTIAAVEEFINKRRDQPEQLNQKRCYILIDREAMTMTLHVNENDEYNRGTVTGKLVQHPKFVEFGVNSGKEWEPNQLGQFIKMNRGYFLDKAGSMKLVSDLKNFNANVSSKVEKQRAESGDFKDNYSGIVTSNLPESFKLNIPLFKGNQPEEIEVEFYASINGRVVSLQLFSPGASQAIDEVRDTIIDEQIMAIKELSPYIAIIEQ